MKTIPIALKAHYESQRLTTAVLCKAIRQDGAIFGFSSVDIDIPYAGLLYRAGALGLSISALDASADLSVPNLEVAGILDSDAITALDIRAGRWDSTSLEFRQVNYRSIADGAEILGIGTTGAVTTQTLGFVTEFRGANQAFSQTVGILTSPVCRAKLGDGKCKVDLVPFTRTGSIGTVISTRKFIDIARSEVNDYWTFGNLTMTSGLSSGLKMEVKRSLADDTIELVLPLFFGLAAGDTYSMTPGCNKLLKVNGAYTGDCKVKFDNVINNQSEPELPGQDRITQYGGRTNG